MRIAITPGEPAGIGPELLARFAQRPLASDSPLIEWVAIADPQVLTAAARQLNVPLKLLPFEEGRFRPHEPGSLSIVAAQLQREAQPGTLDPANARYVLDTLKLAVDGCLARQFDALVTGPVHKGVINDAGVPFTGHTEFLAERSHCDVVMMLATEGLRVALATTHLPLKDVAAALSRPLLQRTLTILQRDLQNKFGLPQPRILVCGLNPHAGEGGHLGMEEIEIIEPVLRELRDTGMELVGPLPADTLFTPRYLDRADAVLAMYHDQGLPVLKFKGFGQAVNITLGLPFIRTSVDHGTALDLAGRGVADLGSLITASDYAARMAGTQRDHQDWQIQ